MKLRIKGSSLRLRITRPELETLGKSGHVVEVVPFPGGAALRYELRVDPSARSIGASFRGNVVSVGIPVPDFDIWKREDQVTLRASQPTGSGEALALLIEKDFACLVEREGEDDSDAFAHPAGPKVC